jgi:hypothetical protein
MPMIMQRNCCYLLFFLFTVVSVQAQRKYDSTMKVGRVGYRVMCNNKQPNKNSITISPIGFDGQMRDISLEIKGRIKGCEVDDVNRDGFADLLIYIFDDNDSLRKGSILGVANDANTGVKPIVLPDILDDPKLRDGYRGQDQFLLMEGMLIRRFPLYTSATEGAAPTFTGKTRQLTYRVGPGEGGNSFKFIVSRTIDYIRQ